MEISIPKKVKPWKTPNFVVVEGQKAGIPLDEIPVDELKKLIEEWSTEVMEKAGYGKQTREIK